jgi:hypothetical protein
MKSLTPAKRATTSSVIHSMLPEELLADVTDGWRGCQ